MNSGGAAAGIGAVFVVVIVVFFVLYAALLAFAVYLYVRIVQKTGWPGWYVLFGLIPIVGIVLFAFKEWPLQRENVWLRSRLAERGMPLPPGPIPLTTAPDGTPVLSLPPPPAPYGYPGGPPAGYRPPPPPGESPEGERPA